MDTFQQTAKISPENYPLARWRHKTTGQRIQSSDLSYRPGSDYHFIGVYVLRDDGVEIFSSVFSNVIEPAVHFFPIDLMLSSVPFQKNTVFDPTGQGKSLYRIQEQLKQTVEGEQA